MKNIKDMINKYCKKLTGDGWLVIYSYDKVVLDKFPHFPNHADIIELDNIREARIFNKTGEVKIWRYNGKLNDRYRDDSELNIYKDQMNLWGNRMNENTLIQQDRGIKLELPIKISQDKLPLKVHVNNYYEFNTDGLIVFKDARLTKITNKQDQEV